METQEVLKRAYTHWIEDGIVEIGLGLLLVMVGGLRATLHTIGKASPLYGWLAVGLIVLMIGYGWGAGYAIKRLKTRVSYPRTGYMSFKPRPRRYGRLVLILLLAGLFGGLAGVLASQPQGRWIDGIIPFTMGCAGAGALLYAGRTTQVKRFTYLAAVSAGIGLTFGVLGIGIVLSVSYFYLSMGFILVVSGSVILTAYLRRHEPVDLYEEDQ